MRNEIINIAGIGFEDLGILQQRLQKDAKCFASQSDEVLYFDKNNEEWVSGRMGAGTFNDFQEASIDWDDFLEKYPLEFVKVEKVEDTVGNFFGETNTIASQAEISTERLEKLGLSGPDITKGWGEFGEMPIGASTLPTGVSSLQDSIDHIAAQEKFGPSSEIDEFMAYEFKSQDDPFSQTFKPKDEAQIWKDRYYSLLAVLNTFGKNP